MRIRIIVDYKLFAAGKVPQALALVIGEQVPGYYVSADQTHFLIQNGYWGR